MFCTASKAILLVCVTISRRTSAGSVGDDVRCGQQICDGKTEYCDPLIEVCTPCEMPCSRTTVSDSKLCKKHCPEYKRLRPRSTTTEVTLSMGLTVSNEKRNKLSEVLAYVYVSFVLLLILVVGVCVLVALELQKLKCKCSTGVAEEGCNTPHASHEKQALVIGLNTCKDSGDVENRTQDSCAAKTGDTSAACVAPADQPRPAVADKNTRRSNGRVAHDQQSKSKTPLDHRQIDSGVGSDPESFLPLMLTTVKTVS